MSNKKIIEKYNELRNTVILASRKKQVLKDNKNSVCCIDFFGDSAGIYDGFIDSNTKVIVGGTIKDLKSFKTGNLDSAYFSLFDSIRNNGGFNIQNEEDLVRVLKEVYNSVIKYFGYGNVNKRIEYYNYNSNVTLESLKDKNLAVCLEDAVLSQNMLKLLGINSLLKVSLVQYNDGKYDTHAYNLIKFNSKYYIFDSRFPALDNPVVKELDENEYLNFTLGMERDKKINTCNNGITYYTCNISLKDVGRVL